MPEPHLSFLGISEQDLRSFEPGHHQSPLSTLLFRASNSDRSRRVTRITVFSRVQAVMGIELQFDSPLHSSSQSTLLGGDMLARPPDWWRWQAQHPPPSSLQKTEMTIDSVGGEEIVAIDFLQSNYVSCFKVSFPRTARHIGNLQFTNQPWNCWAGFYEPWTGFPVSSSSRRHGTDRISS